MWTDKIYSFVFPNSPTQLHDTDNFSAWLTFLEATNLHLSRHSEEEGERLYLSINFISTICDNEPTHMGDVLQLVFHPLDNDHPCHAVFMVFLNLGQPKYLTIGHACQYSAYSCSAERKKRRNMRQSQSFNLKLEYLNLEATWSDRPRNGMRSSFFLSLATFLSVAFASLPSGDVTCGDNVYAVSELTAAINAGIKDLNDNNIQGMLNRLGKSTFNRTNTNRWLPPPVLHVSSYSLTVECFRCANQSPRESSEHITLWCSGDGPWYEVRIFLSIEIGVEWCRIVPFGTWWRDLHFSIRRLPISWNRSCCVYRERNILRVRWRYCRTHRPKANSFLASLHTLVLKLMMDSLPVKAIKNIPFRNIELFGSITLLD